MAKNVLPKHWNGSEFEELHIVTKASNVFTNDNKSVQQKIDDFTSHLADNAYIAPELLNGWENSSTDFRSAGYIKDAHGYVHLTGVIASGVTTPGTTLFNLPLGYRPSRALQFPAFTNGGALIGGVLITILGDVQILSGGNISFSLCGISFKV